MQGVSCRHQPAMLAYQCVLRGRDFIRAVKKRICYRLKDLSFHDFITLKEVKVGEEP